MFYYLTCFYVCGSLFHVFLLVFLCCSCNWPPGSYLSTLVIHYYYFILFIYTHIPETNYVPREYGVASVLLFLFMVLISSVSVLNLLSFYISTFRSMCAVTNMAVFCSYYYYYSHHHLLYAGYLHSYS